MKNLIIQIQTNVDLIDICKTFLIEQQSLPILIQNDRIRLHHLLSLNKK